MAKKPQAPSDEAPRRDDRVAVIDALLALAAEREWDEIALADIAARADVSLSALRGLFPSKGAILSAYAKRIDQAVLDGIDPGMASEPARERLFDTLMRRLDAMAADKAAIRSMMKGLMRDPLSLAALNQVVVNSMRWMLVAAAIDAEGPMGSVRAQGLAVAWSRILRVWLEDDDAGLARTMTAIDKELRSGESWLRLADDLWRLSAPFRRLGGCMMRPRGRMGERMRDRFNDLAGIARGRRRGEDAEAR